MRKNRILQKSSPRRWNNLRCNQNNMENIEKTIQYLARLYPFLDDDILLIFLCFLGFANKAVMYSNVAYSTTLEKLGQNTIL